MSVTCSDSSSRVHFAIPQQLTASSAGSSLLFDINNPDTGLTLDAQLIVETSAPDQLLWPAGCQVQTPTSALCHVSGLLPQESRSLAFAVSDDFQSSDAPVTGQLQPSAVMELQDADNIATVSPVGGVSQAHLIQARPDIDQASISEQNGVSLSSPGQGAANSGSGGIAGQELLWLLVLLFQRGLLIVVFRSSGRVPSSSASSRVSSSIG